MAHRATQPQPHPSWQIAGLILAVLAVKSLFILVSLPSMWIWGDESLYYTTAYDLFHPDGRGVPHPDFLNYPPVTSILISPVHLLGVPSELGYRFSLIILSVVQAIGALIACRIVYEIFGIRSRLLLFLLLIGPVAYSTFCLMSEAPFVTLYLAFLYFYVRRLKTGELHYAVACGLLIGILILTRKVGVGLIAAYLAAVVIEVLVRRDRKALGEALRLDGLAILLGSVIAVSWSLVLEHHFGARHGNHGPVGYLRHGLLPALTSLEGALLLARKFLANLSYVSLSTYGICVPLVAWFCFTRRGPAAEALSRQRELVRRLLLPVAGFALFAAFGAALHMYINSAKPNTRYLMYGRYMEYFSMLLVALAFAIVVTSPRWRRWDRNFLTATAVSLAVAIAWIVPVAFFVKPRIAASNMGIGWLIGLGAGSLPLTLAAGPVVAVALAWMIGAARRSGRRPPALAAYGTIVALALFNLFVSGGDAAGKSRVFKEHFGVYSTFISDHPELFDEGLYIDRRALKKSKRRDRLAAQKVIADHVDKVEVGMEPGPHFGLRPVMSRRRFKDFEILYREEGFVNKIYGTGPPSSAERRPAE